MSSNSTISSRIDFSNNAATKKSSRNKGMMTNHEGSVKNERVKKSNKSASQSSSSSAPASASQQHQKGNLRGVV